MGNTRKILWQMFREMAWPFLIAACWTAYSLVVAPEKQKLVDAITVFGGSFFFACWGFSQWFRVKKQQDVESGLGGIVEKQENLLKELRGAADRLEGHASGGKSIGWLMLVNPQNGTIRNITAHVVGDYPLIEAKASVIDLDKSDAGFEEVKRTGNIHDFFKHHVNFDCGTLQLNFATLQRAEVPYDTSQSVIRFRVEWTARNGKWTQFIQLKRNENRYDFSTAVQRGEEWVYENPKRDELSQRQDGTPDVFWHNNIQQSK